MISKELAQKEKHRIRWPWSRSQPKPVEQPASEQAPASCGKKILIVDDDPVIVKTTSAKLKKFGYDVIAAADGSEAIKAMRDEKPDLVLLDINFPPDVAAGGCMSWNGFQIMSWLRGLSEASRARFILITGTCSVENQNRAFASGAMAIFAKPIDHGALLPEIERAVA